MKTVPAGLAASLASGVTTLCRCWQVARRDGVVKGFTNHDRPLTFAGVTFEPESGFTASESESRLGLAVDTQEAYGILSSSAISENDIALGLWDGAAVTVYLVDWSNLANRAIERSGALGEIGRGPLGFVTEVRSLAHELNQETGRTYQRQCDAVLGDSRCKVNLASGTYRGTGLVTAQTGGQLLTVSGLGAYAFGWFGRGVLTWTSGANKGGSVSVDRHMISGGVVRLALLQAAALSVENGDAFTVTAGCENTWSMCRSKFGNGANFRGFPHMPGNDHVLSMAKQDHQNDGGSLFK
jgi:uncharacterized phage protein (TIGR02218 family)